MKTWNKKRLGLTALFLIATTQLECLSQQARADMTNGTEGEIVTIITRHRRLFVTPPFEAEMREYVLRTGLSTQDLTRVLVNIATKSQNEGFVIEAAIKALGTLRLQDAFEDLQELSKKGRLEEIKRWAMWSALRVAGSRLIPYAREVRDGDEYPRYLKATMYGELRIYLMDTDKIAKEQRYKATDSRRAEIVAFLLDSAEKETAAMQVMHLDIILCEEVPKYDVSAEREGVLRRAQTLRDKTEWKPEDQKALREYIDRGLESLRRLPPDGRTSIKGTLGAIGAP